MAYASPSPFQHLDVAGVAATPAADRIDPAPMPDLPGDSCDADECDNDPITLYPTSRQAVPFYAIIWQAGPGALSEADVRLATRPPRVRH